MLRRSIRFLGRAVLAVGMFALLATSIVSVAHAGSVYVHGYYRSNGTYVMPHYRSAPDGNFWNNWSTQGNVNPYTGAWGTKSYPSYSSYYHYYPTYRSYTPSYGSYWVPTYTYQPTYTPSYRSSADDDESSNATKNDDDDN